MAVQISASVEVEGRYSNGNAREEADRIVRSGKSGIYSAVQTTIANAQTNTDITTLTGASALFTALQGSRANFIDFYTDQDLTIKVRTRQNAGIATASLPTIKLRANTLRTITWLADITAIYISNASGNTANIDVSLI